MIQEEECLCSETQNVTSLQPPGQSSESPDQIQEEKTQIPVLREGAACMYREGQNYLGTIMGDYLLLGLFLDFSFYWSF